MSDGRRPSKLTVEVAESWVGATSRGSREEGISGDMYLFGGVSMSRGSNSETNDGNVISLSDFTSLLEFGCIIVGQVLSADGYIHVNSLEVCGNSGYLQRGECLQCISFLFQMPHGL